jgi:hypothetical protein
MWHTQNLANQSILYVPCEGILLSLYAPNKLPPPLALPLRVYIKVIFQLWHAQHCNQNKTPRTREAMATIDKLTLSSGKRRYVGSRYEQLRFLENHFRHMRDESEESWGHA